MGQRRERRLQRARHVRVGIAVGTALAVLAGAVAIFGTTFHDGSAAADSSVAAAPASAPAAQFVRPSEQQSRSDQKKRARIQSRLQFHTVVKTVITKRPPNPFPPPPPNSGVGRRVVYCNSCQRVWLVESDGWVTAYYKVSGRRNYPRSGTYKVIRRINPGWSHTLRLPYFVGFTYGNTTDVGFHGIPKRPNGSQIENDSELGLWRSHGCVRESQADAKVMWDWASMGTTVVAIP